MPADRAGPGERPTRGGLGAGQTEWVTRSAEAIGRLVRKFTYAEFPWQEAQQAGLTCVPLRRPEENVSDEHWRVRGTYAAIDHPEHGRSFLDVTSKWLSSDTTWVTGRRAPLPDEDRATILALAETTTAEAVPERAKAPAPATAPPKAATARRSPHSKPFALDGIRILDFTWFLASAGGTRFLAAMGAESIKVEWAAYPDTKMMAMAPIGGRAAREAATASLEGVKDPDLGGQFNNKNPGKRGISLNVAHPKGLAIARRLVPLCDIVAEGFSPGVMERWGLGYDELRKLKPDIIYAQQSGMGTKGVYGRFRSGGPTAASLAGTSEMSGLPEPAMPAGWGYSFLDWIGAYSFATAMLAALYHRDQTGRGQWIDASQTETGIFIGGTAALDWSAHGRRWQRSGNRSPYLPAAPHGAYPLPGNRPVGSDRLLQRGRLGHLGKGRRPSGVGRGPALQNPCRPPRAPRRAR